MMETLNSTGRWMEYLSLLILTMGLIVVPFKTMKWVWGYLFLLLILEFSGVFLNHIFGENLLILTLSSLLHFLVIGYLFLVHIWNMKTSFFLYASMGILILVAFLIFQSSENMLSYYAYDRVVYSLVISGISLKYTFEHISRRSESTSHILWLSLSIFLFFFLDALLGIGTDFLVKENLLFVAWFWLLRAVFLQLFYCILIYFSWQTGKTQQLR